MTNYEGILLMVFLALLIHYLFQKSNWVTGSRPECYIVLFLHIRNVPGKDPTR